MSSRLSAWSVIVAAAIVLLGAGSGTTFLPRTVAIVSIVAAAGLLSACLARPDQWPGARRRGAVIAVVWLLVAVQLVLFVKEQLRFFTELQVSGAALLVATALVATAAAIAVDCARERPLLGRASIVVLVLLHLVLGHVVYVAGRDVRIDVLEFLRRSSAALLAGENPYLIDLPDIYPEELSRLFNGPGNSVDGTLTFGLVYPPAILLPVLPAHLAGDVRHAGRLAVALTAALLVVLGAGSRPARLAAVLFLLTPATLRMTAHGWTETILGAAMVAAVLAAQRDSRATPYLFGFFISLKQYTVLFLPLYFSLRAGRTRRWPLELLFGLAPWIVITAGFAAWDFPRFYFSLVELRFTLPLRPDALTLQSLLANAFGWRDVGHIGWLALAAVVIVLALGARRGNRTPGGFCLAVAALWTWVLVLGENAFVNYYFLAIVAAAAAMAAAAAQEPADGEGGAAQDLSAAGPGPNSRMLKSAAPST